MTKTRNLIKLIAALLCFCGFHLFVRLNGRADMTVTKSNKREVKLVELRPKVEYLNTPSIEAQGCRNNPCPGINDVAWTMVFLTKSACTNKNQRDVIRETWGTFRQIQGGRFMAIFVVGLSNSAVSQATVDNEANSYRDILQVKAPDNYTYVVMKTLAGMQWASENLPEDYFYASVDDDIVLDILRVKRIIDHRLKSPYIKKWKEFPFLCMHGTVENRARKPIRDADNKNFISKHVYPWPRWPVFCLGGMYITSVRIARLLWQLSRSERLLPVDDVWITGILRTKLGMPDEMVLMAPPPIPSVHCQGSTKLMQEKWKIYSVKLNNVKVCTCSTKSRQSVQFTNKFNNSGI